MGEVLKRFAAAAFISDEAPPVGLFIQASGYPASAVLGQLDAFIEQWINGEHPSTFPYVLDWDGHPSNEHRYAHAMAVRELTPDLEPIRMSWLVW